MYTILQGLEFCGGINGSLCCFWMVGKKLEVTFGRVCKLTVFEGILFHWFQFLCKMESEGSIFYNFSFYYLVSETFSKMKFVSFLFSFLSSCVSSASQEHFQEIFEKTCLLFDLQCMPQRRYLGYRSFIILVSQQISHQKSSRGILEVDNIISDGLQ